MPENNDVETAERGKAEGTIRELAEGLIRETDSRENRFRPEWVELLLERYRHRPGRPTVHLSDFVGHVQLRLRPETHQLVEPFWDRLVQKDGRWAWRHFRSVVNYLKGGPGTPRLTQWKRFGDVTGFDLDCLESHIDCIKISDGPHVRLLHSPKLPVNLASPAGAHLIGYYFDSNRTNGSFSNKDPILHEDFRKTVRDVFGDLMISETVMESGGFRKGCYLRSNAGYVVRTAMEVSGFDCSRNQTVANNPLPSWLFNCSTPSKSETLSSLWDTEGSVNPHDLKVRQAAPFNPCGNSALPDWPKTIAFRQSSVGDQSHILQSPPLVIVSAALMLFSMGIVSRLEPTGMTSSHGDPTAYWQLRVQREASVRAFQAQIRLRSVLKQSKLDALVRNTPSLPPFFH